MTSPGQSDGARPESDRQLDAAGDSARKRRDLEVKTVTVERTFLSCLSSSVSFVSELRPERGLSRTASSDWRQPASPEGLDLAACNSLPVAP